jgi:hypothetical protein
MSDLKALEDSIIADGKVDAEEVNSLRKVLLADGKIDRQEADTLFRINDAVTNGDNDPSWSDFFAEALSDHVLKDEATPGVVSDEEASYLKSRIDTDGSVDAAERALISTLKDKAQQPIPADLQGLIDTYL